ncbi:hypothetical protein DNTS_035839 [Danionella cerebrum]|uniref:Uncharacterized protein n=1 Tax=Danionella cerebrum TaxID=2873325 RepID=A0A553Q3H7_9TELE|nr:hypothetical protein DNTS_035839 [Danionella translucida]
MFAYLLYEHGCSVHQIVLSGFEMHSEHLLFVSLEAPCSSADTDLSASLSLRPGDTSRNSDREMEEEKSAAEGRNMKEKVKPKDGGIDENTFYTEKETERKAMESGLDSPWQTRAGAVCCQRRGTALWQLFERLSWRLSLPKVNWLSVLTGWKAGKKRQVQTTFCPSGQPLSMSVLQRAEDARKGGRLCQAELVLVFPGCPGPHGSSDADVYEELKLVEFETCGSELKISHFFTLFVSEIFNLII